jgi:capsular polysaccharide export protein
MAPPRQRTFLFLQGPLSPLYRRLAAALEREGHAIVRINLCFGDWLHWRRSNSVSYRGRPGEPWRAYVAGFLQDRGITDIVLHGDQRPYHKIAAEEGRKIGIQIIVTELGYLRPDWMTLERDGTSAASHFPRTPQAIRRLAARYREPDLTRRHAAHFVHVAIPDVIYNLSSTALWFLYPHFRRHTIYFPPLEYLAWIGRLATARRREQAADMIIERLKSQSAARFILPLQLEGDFQIRMHAPFDGQAEGLRLILASFARHSPPGTHLLIKSHPLDNGLERWGSVINGLADAAGIPDRVHFVDGGSLTQMLSIANGVVTINSSAGLEALLAGVPVKTLGPAIYDVAGLTHQGPLDSFWTAPSKPDSQLVRDFVRALAGAVQVRGTLYSRDGLDAAVSAMSQRILANSLLAPGSPDGANPGSP